MGIIKKIKKRITSSKVFIRSVEWTKTHSLPGFEGIPIFNVFAFVAREMKKEKIIVRANAMAFSFFLALFPSIIVLFSILPYLPIGDLVETMKESVLQLMPAQAADYIINTIDSLTSKGQGGILSVGVFLTFWFASNGMLSMLRGFEKNYKISYEPRSGLKRRLVALELTLILGFTFIVTMAAIVFGRAIMDGLMRWTDLSQHRYEAFLIVRWFGIILLFYSGISVVYRFGSTMRDKIKFISPGATFATTMSILTSIAFSYYINEYSAYNELYGSIGALIVLMIWIQINSLIILIGYEMNAGIQINKDLAIRELEMAEQTGELL